MKSRPKTPAASLPNRWTIGLARENLSGVLKAAEHRPQEIYNRKRLAAVVVPPGMVSGYSDPRRAPRTIAEIFHEAGEIAARTNWTLPVTRRSNRPNAFLKLLNHRAR